MEIAEVTKGDTRLDQVEALFRDFYNGMEKQGLMMPLVDGGEKIWRKSAEKTLGKVNQLFIAIENENVVGFSLGTLRMIPEFLGGHLVGFVGGLYVLPEFRKMGVGEALYFKLEEWFKSKKVHSFELQVLTENYNGIKFWENSSYQKELFQMRKLTQ